jgi:L-threonate 2-dehydrogenase
VQADPASSPLRPPAAVAVAGLGAMGSPIAQHLVAAGYLVSGYDPEPAAMDAAMQFGVRAAASITVAAEHSEALVTSLPSSAALDVVTAELAAAPGRVSDVIEVSTLSVADKERAADLLRPTGIRLLDAPISGTSAQMRARDVVIYASGDPDGLQRCHPVLEALARKVFDTGGFGNGSRLKLVANLLVAVHNAAAAEAIALATACGLSPSLILPALIAGAGSSRMLQLRGPMMIERQYTPPAMRLELFGKDLHLIESLARESGAATPLLAASAELYAAAARAGHGDEDTASVLEALLAAAAVEPS